MNNGRINQTRGATRDVIKILGKRVCANGENRWQKPQNSGVLRRESPPVLVVWGVVVGLFMSGDSKASVADTNVPDNDISSSANQTHSATLTITMITPPLPDD